MIFGDGTMVFRVFIFSVFLTLPLVYSFFPARAEDGVVSLHGNACETISGDETMSTARVRVTDKAVFNAVSALPFLKTYKEQLDSHDFNVLVYEIVDEYVEDLSVKTTEQSADKICVEISGYVSDENVSRATDDFFNKQADAEPLSDDQTTENTAELSEEITHHLEENYGAGNESALLQENSPLQEGSASLPEAEISSLIKSRIYAAPVEFFNHTQSAAHAKIVSDWFVKNEHLETAADEKDADYIVKTKVLRAKVEALNTTSSRLHMVISMELSFADGRKAQTVHQNRFVLFENNEDEQQAALKLLKKLFYNACEQLNTHIQQAEREKGNIPALPRMITPAGQETSVEPEVPEA